MTDDKRWADWSQAQLEQATSARPLIINDVIYAEISTRHSTVEDVDAMLRDLDIDLVAIPRTALFLAGKAYLRYRAMAAFAPACCRISSSALMRRSNGCRC